MSEFSDMIFFCNVAILLTFLIQDFILILEILITLLVFM
jgi:hypothetical protein